MILPCCMGVAPLVTLIASGLMLGACFNFGITAVCNRRHPRGSQHKPSPCRQGSGAHAKRMKSAAAGTDRKRSGKRRGSLCKIVLSPTSCKQARPRTPTPGCQKSRSRHSPKAATRACPAPQRSVRCKDKSTETCDNKSAPGYANRPPRGCKDPSYGYIRAKKGRENGVSIKRNKFGCDIEY